MKMFELVTWFQKEYPELVSDMMHCSHHLTYLDKMIIGQRKDLYNREGYIGIPESSKQAYSVNPFHLEGDVWTHTMLVCKQAENAPYEVQIAALLHDIGKPATRSVNPKNGRVSFYNHDAVSAFMSLEIMERLGLSDSQKKLIFNMIALHTQVYKLSVEQLAEIGDMYLVDNLIKLGNCDHEGRFHSQGNAVIPTFEEILTAKESPVCRDVDKEVVILCGLPGSGKSTWIDEIGKMSDMIVSRDGILEANTRGKDYSEKWQNADQKAIDKLLQGQFKRSKEHGFERVFVDMTHMSKKSRRRSLSHFGKDYKKTCVVFLPTLEEIKLRNEQRCGKNIGKDVIEKMMRSFYPPTYSEFDEIIWRF